LTVDAKGSVNVAVSIKEDTMPDSSITQRLASLPQLGMTEFCNLWQQLFKEEAPMHMRKNLMLRILAYRLQEQQLGGLSEASCRRLRQLASAWEADPDAAISSKPPIKPGTRLLREWKQQVHVVEVEAESYEYRGHRYESLSEIARLITGTRWSGPLFFGLKGKQSMESKEAQ
jgi:hypothetical protein